MLFSGEYMRTDELLSEGKSAPDLDVGRSSVRATLHLLNAGGYVEIIPNRGAFASICLQRDTYTEHRTIYNAIAVYAAARVAMQLHIITAKRQVKFTEKV